MHPHFSFHDNPSFSKGNIYCSLLGYLQAQQVTSATEDVDKWIISIEPETKQDKSQSSYSANSTSLCPKIGDTVLGRITKVIRPSHATVDILAIISDTTKTHTLQPLYEPYSATLRTNELRPNSSLEVEISDCIRPSDIIIAKIHALGEKDYILTTVEAELGVIKAVCESSGKEMKAISWKEMECVETGLREARKVAKPKVVG